MAHQPKAYKKFVATAATATLVATAIVPVASAATASDFTDVNSNYKDAVTYLVEQGITNGKTATTFGTTENITRGDAAVFIARALKLDVDNAKDQGFTDLNNRVKNAVNAIVEAKIAGGKSDTKFDPDANITRQEMAKMLANAYDLTAKENANFKDVNSNWIGYVSALKEAGITLGKTETTFAPTANLTRGEFALFMYRAEGSPAVGVVALSSVKASSAKTITVKFNKAVDTTKAKIEVSRGTVKPSVKEVKFSDDKKSATIEFTTAMAAGEYTVSVTGLTEAALTGKVTVEAEKLTKINFLSDVAVIVGDDITTRVTAENQYGEDVTSKLTAGNISATTSKGTSVSIDKDGNLKVVGSAGLFKVDDKVVVTVVDSSTGVSATKTLTVAQAAKVESITFGEIKTDDAELAKKQLNVANMDANASKYYIPVTIKDQYGNTLKAAELAGVTAISSNSNIVKLKTGAGAPFKDTKNGLVIELEKPTSATYGTAVITVVSAGTGKTANTSITVKENSKLDVVTLEAPASALKLTKASELPVSIINTYGDEVALKDVTVGGTSTALTLDTNTTINAIGATLKVEQDYVNKKAVLKLTPTAKNITLTVVTATGKSQVLSLTATDAPVVSGIKGLDEDFAALLANDGSLTTNLKGAVEFVDQYGEVIAAPTFDETDAANALDFTIKEKDATNTVTGLANGVITSSTTAGSESYEVVLKNAAGDVLDTLDVTVSVVDKDKLTAFGVEDLNKFYTGATSAAHNQQVEIYGLQNGKRVVVNQNMLKDVSASAGLVIGSDGAFTAALKNTDGKDVASTLTVLVANKDNTYTITKDVVYSSAAPVATSVVAKYNGVTITGGVKQVPYTELNKNVVDGTSKLQFTAKDQYGVARTTGFTVVETNNSATGTVASNGDGSGFVAGDAGESLQLNVRIDGVSQAVRIIVGE